MKTFLLFLAIPVAVALAQGSGSIATPPSVSGSDGAPFRVTKGVTGVVLSIDEKSISVEDAKTRKAVELTLGPGGKIRVSGAGGVKKIEDVTKGATVRINYAVDDRRVLDLRVVKAGDK